MGTERNALFRWGFLAAALLVVMQARAALFHVTVDTSALAGTPAALAFGLTSSIGAPSNSVTISGFTNIGSADPVGPAYLGDAFAPYVSVPALATSEASVTLSNTNFYIEYLQYVTLGSEFAFDFSPSAELAGPPPDTFAFAILVGTHPPPVPEVDGLLPYLVLSTSDDGGTLFSYEIGVTDPTQPVVYRAFTQGDDPVDVPIDVDVISIPEPGALVLAVSALLTMGLVRRTRKVPPRRT